MAEVRQYARLWPLAFAAVGVAGLVYAAYQWSRVDESADVALDDASDEPVTDPGPDSHFEKVRMHLLDEYTAYTGTVESGGSIPVRAPEGMRFPIVKVHHEQGDFVKKGDTLVTFAKQKIEKAIESAKQAGDFAREQRLRAYLDAAELKAPVDGVVLTIHRTLGEIPLDVGIPVVTLADEESFRFVVKVPADVQQLSMPISAKFDVELQDEMGTVKGVVTEFESAVGTDVPVVIGLAPHEGIEQGLSGTVRVVSGRKEVGLVPKSAVIHRGDVPIVRVWDAESRSIAERTVRLGDAAGAEVVVLAGVYVDESIVVPGRKRDP